MTRTERLWAVASFVVALAVVLVVFGSRGALGPIELLIATVFATPIAILIYALTIGLLRAIRRQP